MPHKHPNQRNQKTRTKKQSRRDRRCLVLLCSLSVFFCCASNHGNYSPTSPARSSSQSKPGLPYSIAVEASCASDEVCVFLAKHLAIWRCLLQADARHTLLVRQLSSVYSEITSGVSEGIGGEIFGW